MKARLLRCGLFFLAGLHSVQAEAGVYNLRLLTDNVPDYTDIESLARSSTAAWQSPQDKCIAVWRWGRRSRRQTSCAVEEGRHVWDPILHYNSYGAMNCGIISSLNIGSWLQLGYRARYVQLGDHTVSEVSWDDGRSWHLFDSSMSIFCYNHANVVASCEEIKGAGACELSGGKSEPGHDYFYHYAPQCGSHPGPTGWRCAADQPVGYNRTLSAGASSYTDGFSVDRYCQMARFGHRYVLNLRPYESYTRYWEPLDRAGRKGGPAAGDPDTFRPLADGSDPDAQHGLHNLRGNGRWVFQPDLAAADRRTLFYDDQGLAAAAEPGRGPRLCPAVGGQTAWVVFKIDAANVITSMRIEADGLRATTNDALRVLVSRDTGMHWTLAWEARATGPQAIRLKLRDQVAGRTQCQVKIEMLAHGSAGDAGLDRLTLETITQLNRRTLPGLTLGSNQVLLRADQQVETAELWPALHAGAYRRTMLKEDDVASDPQPDGMYKATLGAGANNKECSVAWCLTVPGPITGVTYGAVSTNRSPHSYVALQHGWDGERWSELDRNRSGGFPFDKQVVRTLSGRDVPEGARRACFRGVFFCTAGAGTYNMPGLQDLLLRVHHKPRDAAFRPIEVTCHWTEHREEGDVNRSHTELVKSLPHRYAVHVAGKRDPTMNWVRLNVQGHGPEGTAARGGYSDGVDVGPGWEYPKVAYRWGRHLALGKPYTASRASSAASGNPDAEGRELTNGIVIAPTDSVTASPIQPATAFWDPGEPLTLVVDLGKTSSVAGFRVSTHQPNARYCHPKSVGVSVSADGRAWERAGGVRHDDLWKTPGDYEPWEHDDDPRYAPLPAGGRLAYGYSMALPRPLEARYVRFVCTPLDGKGLGLSELQVYDQVVIAPWPGAECPLD